MIDPNYVNQFYLWDTDFSNPTLVPRKNWYRSYTGFDKSEIKL